MRSFLVILFTCWASAMPAQEAIKEEVTPNWDMFTITLANKTNEILVRTSAVNFQCPGFTVIMPTLSISCVLSVKELRFSILPACSPNYDIYDMLHVEFRTDEEPSKIRTIRGKDVGVKGIPIKFRGNEAFEIISGLADTNVLEVGYMLVDEGASSARITFNVDQIEEVTKPVVEACGY